MHQGTLIQSSSDPQKLGRGDPFQGSLHGAVTFKTPYQDKGPNIVATVHASARSASGSGRCTITAMLGIGPSTAAGFEYEIKLDPQKRKDVIDPVEVSIHWIAIGW